MPLLKIILAGLFALFALAAGLLAAVVAALGGALFMLFRRILRRQRQIPAPHHGGGGEMGTPRGEVIDVTATEVRPDRPASY